MLCLQKSMINSRILVIYILLMRFLNPDMATNRLIGWILLLGCCALLVIGRISRKIQLTPYLVWNIAFIAICGFSIFWSLSMEYAFDYFKNLVIIIVVVYIISLSIKSIEDVYTMLRIYLAAILTNALYLILKVDWGSIGFERLGADNAGDLWNSNTIGMSMAIGIGLALFLIPKEKWLWKLVSIVVMAIPFIFTGSRKAWVLLAMMLVILVMVNNPKKIIRNIIICLFILILFLYLIMEVPILYNIVGYRFEGFFALFSGATGMIDSSALKRQLFITLGFEWFQDRPILGYGLNCYRFLLGKSYMALDTYSHNNYIELLVSVGIIGTSIFYSIYIYYLVKAYKYVFVSAYKVPLKVNRVLILLSGIVVAQLFMQTGSVSYVSIETYFILLLLGSVLVFYKRSIIENG